MWNTFSVRLSRSTDSATEAISLALHSVSRALNALKKKGHMAHYIVFIFFSKIFHETQYLRVYGTYTRNQKFKRTKIIVFKDVKTIDCAYTGISIQELFLGKCRLSCPFVGVAREWIRVCLHTLKSFIWDPLDTAFYDTLTALVLRSTEAIIWLAVQEPEPELGSRFQCNNNNNTAKLLMNWQKEFNFIK